VLTSELVSTNIVSSNYSPHCQMLMKHARSPRNPYCFWLGGRALFYLTAKRQDAPCVFSLITSLQRILIFNVNRMLHKFIDHLAEFGVNQRNSFRVSVLG
jgi:hypothetical protein